jgi:hypothetical protein
MRNTSEHALGRRPLEYLEPEFKAAGAAATVAVVAIGFALCLLIAGLVCLGRYLAII